MKPLTLPGKPESLERVTTYVLTVGRAAGLDSQKMYRLRLAIDEIATNIVVHGYAEAGIEGNLRIWACDTAQQLIVYIEDQGLSYDPHQFLETARRGLPPQKRPSEAGFGIYLALSSVDHFHYETKEGCNRSIFVINKI